MITREVITATNVLGQEWGVYNINSIEDHTTGGYHNGVIKITHGVQEYAYKPYASDSKKLLRFTAKVLNHADSKGFKSFPGLLPTLNGEYFAQTQDGSLGILLPWIDGKPISLTEPGAEKREKLLTIARTIAQFHLATDTFYVTGDTICDETMAEAWVPEMIERHTKTKALLVDKHNIFRQLGVENDIRLLLAKSEPLMKEMANTTEVAKMESSLTKGIVHADLWIGHWLFTKRKEAFLIDFDRMRYGRRIDDIERIVSESMDLGDQYPKAVLEEYLKYIRVDDNDLKFLPKYLRYSVVRRTFWLIDQYIKRGHEINSMPLQLSDEVGKATTIINTDLEKLLN